MSNAPKPAMSSQDSWHLIRRLYRESLRHHLFSLTIAFICMALVAVMSSSQTYLMGPLIDKVFIAGDSRMLWVIAGAVLGIFAVRSAARYAQEVVLVRLGQKIVADTQARLFRRVIRQDMSLFQSRPAGSLAAHFTYDANAMRLAVCDVFLVAGKDTLTILTMIGLMFLSDWRLALVTLLIVPLSIFPVLYLGQKMRRISLRTQVETGELTDSLTQAFQGIRTVKSFGLEPMEQRRTAERVNSLANLVIKGAWVGGAILPIVDGIGGFVVAIVIIYGGAQVIAQVITPGTLFVFVGALVGAYAPVPSLSKVNVTLQTGLAAAQRIFALIDRRSAVSDAADARSLPRVSGAVTFEGVRFSYDSGAAALNGLDLVAPAGAITALVGRSGAGKSTALSLISRFYDPDAGRVLVNGADLRGVRLASLRDCIALVSQDVTLFDDTIANNIRYGRLDASDAEVRQAAEAACCAFVLALPEGFETRVGEQGLRLSGGERQRIAVARAILKDAPILLLDEATSAQDAGSDHQIQRAIARLMWGRTTIVIAQRLATIRNADVIHVIDSGRVIESGDHDQLLAKGGLYAHLHALQFPENEASDQDEPATLLNPAR